MKFKFTRNFRITYLAFCLPFILALLSWMYFPVAAQWIVTNVFGYRSVEQAANPVWYVVTRLFYSWYTLLAIGIAGSWVVAAIFARRKHV